MTQISLEQHYYASAPIGLTAGRGFKSVARSVGLGPPDAVEDHCFYYRPTGKKDQRPVNWGWVRLADGRVCVHRVGFSGNDDQNRPLNFLAANFVASKDALDAIDYDIPSLIRWINDKNPDRYLHPNGKQLGFAYRHDQLYEQQGWNPKELVKVTVPERVVLSQLKAVPVPLEGLHSYSEAADKALAQTWERLKPLRDKGVLKALFQALLCRPGDRRTVVVVSAGDGETDSETERLVAEFLFTILPYHCRKALTYSTYFGQDAGGGVFPDRQLVFTTKFNTELTLPTEADGSSGWLINGAGGTQLVPRTVSATAKFYIETTDAARWDELLRIRDRASAFDFSKDVEWVADVRQMLRWSSAPNFTAEDFDSFFRAANGVRPSAPELLEDAHRFAAMARPGHGVLTSPINLVRSYLTTVVRLHPSLPQEVRTEQDPLILGAVGGLFDWCFVQLHNKTNRDGEKEAYEAISELLTRILTEPALQVLRSDLLAACLDKLETRLGSPQSDDFGRCKKFWGKVRDGSVPRDFVERTAIAATHLIYQFAESVGTQLAGHMKEFVVPVLAWLDSPTAEDLHERLVFISGIALDDDAPLVQLLTEASRNNKLPDALLNDIVENNASYLLHWFAAWTGLIKVDKRAAKILEEKLESPELVASWWIKPPAAADSPLTKSALALMNGQIAAEKSEGRISIAHEFPEKPSPIVAALRQTEETYSPLLSIRLSAAHFTLSRLMLRTADEVAASKKQEHVDWATAVRTKAVSHLGVIFGWLVSRAVPEAVLSGREALKTFVRSFVRFYGDPESRTLFTEYAANQTAGFNPRPLDYDEAILTEWRRELTEATKEKDWQPLTETEAEWLSRVYCERDRGRAAALLLIRRPNLAVDKPRDAFAQYFVREVLGKTPAIWNEVATQFTNDALRTMAAGKLESWASNWLGDSAQRRPLVDELRTRKLLGDVGATLLASATAKAEDNETAVDGVAELHQLARLPGCPELSDPAKPAYFAAVADMLKRRAANLRAAVRKGQSPSADSVAVDLEYVVDSVKHVKSPAVLWEFWIAVAEWLASLDRKVISTVPIRTLIRLGSNLPQAAVENPKLEPWYRLFEPFTRPKAETKPAAHREMSTLDAGAGDSCSAAEAFVLLAETLYSPVFENDLIESDDPTTAGEPFRTLAQVLKDPRLTVLSEGIWEQISALPRSRWLSEESGWNLPAFGQFVGRARLLDALFGRDPAAVGRAYAAWGDTEQQTGGTIRHTYFSAFALVGYLTVNGKDLSNLKTRISAMAAPEFWTAFRKVARDRERTAAIFRDVEKFLPYVLVGPDDVEAVAKRFEKLLGR